MFREAQLDALARFSRQYGDSWLTVVSWYNLTIGPITNNAIEFMRNNGVETNHIVLNGLDTALGLAYMQGRQDGFKEARLESLRKTSE